MYSERWKSGRSNQERAEIWTHGSSVFGQFSNQQTDRPVQNSDIFLCYKALKERKCIWIWILCCPDFRHCLKSELVKGV